MADLASGDIIFPATGGYSCIAAERRQFLCTGKSIPISSLCALLPAPSVYSDAEHMDLSSLSATTTSAPSRRDNKIGVATSAMLPLPASLSDNGNTVILRRRSGMLHAPASVVRNCRPVAGKSGRTPCMRSSSILRIEPALPELGAFLVKHDCSSCQSTYQTMSAHLFSTSSKSAG